jgi:uncharacterized protein (TIGR02453 family)
VKKDEKKFTGFSADSFEFLTELRDNNNRQWFDLNRERWQGVREELLSVCRSLEPFFGHLDPELETTPKSGRCLGRINRDTRFTPDKHPYREYIDVLFFPRDHGRTDSPGLAVGLTAEHCYIGAWRGAAMNTWRERFIVNAAAFPDILERYLTAQNNFRDMWVESASYSRPKVKGLPSLADQWTRRKYYYMGLTVPAAEVVSRGESLLETIEETFVRLYPLHLFSTAANLAPALELFRNKFPDFKF